MTRSVTATAPATLANLGSGFDVLGLALAGDVRRQRQPARLVARRAGRRGG